ncbi:MAG: hypothetical protein LBC65_00865 [Oscillospiraceae bacterium]|nr:hypothetical protein [Oscillospiraceae bacterium]
MSMSMMIPVFAAVLPVVCVQLFSLMSTRKTQKDRLHKLESDINQLMLKVTRVEIMSLCDHDRGNIEMHHLLTLYDFYKDKGGNSYIDSLVARKKEEVNAMEQAQAQALFQAQLLAQAQDVS